MGKAAERHFHPMQQTEFTAGLQSVELMRGFVTTQRKMENATERNSRGKMQGGILDFSALVVGTFPKAFGKPLFVPCLHL